MIICILPIFAILCFAIEQNKSLSAVEKALLITAVSLVTGLVLLATIFAGIDL